MQGGEFGLGFGPGHRGDGLGAFAAAGELRHHFERCPSGAEAAQHGEETDRANCLGAAQPQPIETLLRIEFARGQGLPQLFLKEIRLSVPAIRRRIFSWCRRMINRAIPAITNAVALSAIKAATTPHATAATSAASEE